MRSVPANRDNAIDIDLVGRSLDKLRRADRGVGYGSAYTGVAGFWRRRERRDQQVTDRAEGGAIDESGRKVRAAEPETGVAERCSEEPAHIRRGDHNGDTEDGNGGLFLPPPPPCGTMRTLTSVPGFGLTRCQFSLGISQPLISIRASIVASDRCAGVTRRKMSSRLLPGAASVLVCLLLKGSGAAKTVMSFMAEKTGYFRARP